MYSRFAIVGLVLALVLNGGCANNGKSEHSPRRDGSQPGAKRARVSSDTTPSRDEFRNTFPVEKSNLAATADNKYFPIQPGRVWKYRNGDEFLIITVLPETRTVDGVTCAIIEEREGEGDDLVEVSRNWFAGDKTNGDAYYFGEEVDMYKNDKITSHGGAWESGVNGARFGLIMPAQPKVGEKYYQEVAPKVAMDRAEIVSMEETVKTPAGTFEHCLHTKETTPLEGDVSHKWYAPGIGLIKDGKMMLAEMPVKAK
jgi:hypothetical protein